MLAAGTRPAAPDGGQRVPHFSLAPREMRQWKTLLLAVAAAFFGYYAGSHSVIDSCVCGSQDVDAQTIPLQSFYASETALQINVEKRRNVAKQIVDLLSELKQSNNMSRASVMMALNSLLTEMDPQLAASDDKVFRTGATPRLPDACWEEYKGSRFGSPVYRTGFVEAADCPREKMRSLEELITVLLVLPPAPFGEYQNLLSSVQENFPRLPLLVAAADDHVLSQLNGSHAAVPAAREEFATPGVLWNRLVQAARTPYVLVGRDLDFMDELARLKRLIYVISSSIVDSEEEGVGVAEGVAVAGGAFRNRTGHWAAGCHRASLRRYGFTLAAGYRRSARDCMLCDVADGPFVARAATLRRLPLDARLPPAPLFVDWFLRLRDAGALAAVCLDAMFFTRSPVEKNPSVFSTELESWRVFAKKWRVEHIVLASKLKHRFSCSELGIRCNLRQFQRQGVLIPPCCIQEAADALGALKDFAARHNIQFELNEGSALAAVKLRSFLPWDIDGDILIKYTDYETFSIHRDEIEKMGCKFAYFTSKDNFRYFHFLTPNITVDMWCRNNLSEFALPQGMQQFPTLVKILGQWVRGPWNPGLFARNRYGPSYLKHAQHWSKLGLKDHLGMYSAGMWTNCTLRNHHSCLNNYPTDGSFEFVPENFA